MRRWSLLLSIPILAVLVWAGPTPTIADNDPGEPIEETPWYSCQGCETYYQFFQNGFVAMHECAPLPELQTEGLKNCQTNAVGCEGDVCHISWV